MPRFVAVLILFALAGCISSTPRQTVAEGARHEFASAKTARQTANCVTRNGQNMSVSYDAKLTDFGADEYEITVTAPGTSAGAIVVAQVSPASDGSKLVFFTSPHMPESAIEGWIEKLRTGC